MKILFLAVLLILLSSHLFAHSGGTDQNGCHAGSQPRHCHGGSTSTPSTFSSDSSSNSDLESISVPAWDINLGFKWFIDDGSPIPYFGLSFGKEYEEEDVALGADLGIESGSGIYFGYVSTSNSLQLGFRALHLSVNQNSIGIGLRFPPGGRRNVPLNSTIYFSGSGLFVDEDEEL